MKILYISTFILLFSCVPDKQKVGAIYYNAYIYSSLKVQKPFRGGIAILNDTIIAFDSSHKILMKYDSDIKEDLDLKSIYPKKNYSIEIGKVANISIE